MRSVLALWAAALVLGAAGLVSAQTPTLGSGTVVRVDPHANVIMLDDGRMYRVTPGSVLVLETRPTSIMALQPGQRIVVQSGEAVTLRDGQYVAVTPGSAGVGVPPAPGVPPPPGAPVTAPQPPTTVVIQSPAAAVAPGLRQTFYGRVADIDRDGEVTIHTEGGEFEVKVAPETLPRIRKGDAVRLDMIFNPPGTPAASPR